MSHPTSSAEPHPTPGPISGHESGPSLARRRDKPQLSCHYCRRRKLRCDRRHPCSNCVSRDLHCVYASQHEVHQGSIVQDRLAHLESLVTSLMARSGQRTASTTNPSPGSGELGVGSMTAHAAGLPYVGDDHWAAVLESIEGLKDQFRELDLSDAAGRSKHASLLYGPHSCVSREDIIAALPARHVVDRHLSCYFNRLGLAYYVVHAPTFLRQYQSFWDEPSGTPVMWIGLLFSMISLAVLASGDHQPDVYCEKAVQCLILGEYTRAGPHTLETLIHYINIEFSRHADAGGDLWYLLGLTVNVAMRAGYHRDPSNFSLAESTMQQETRRRLWASVLLGDVLISSQMGMPCMISASQWDTREPLNLADSDDADCQPRAETEYTLVLNIIAGRRIAVAIGAISSATNTSALDYAQVMHLDKVLNAAGDTIPSVLKMKPMQASIADAPQIIMSRLFIAHMVHKGKLMLHRRYLRSETDYDYSRRVCIDASLDVLDIQRTLHEEIQPGGRLEMMRWRVSSIMNHQFLIATMVLCFVVRKGVRLSQEGDEKIKSALQTAKLIWERTASTSREAARATEAIHIVLTRGETGDCEASQGCLFNGEMSIHDVNGPMEGLMNDPVFDWLSEPINDF